MLPQMGGCLPQAVLGQRFLGKAICISYLEKNLFTTFVHFKIIFLLLNFKSALYILDTGPLADMFVRYFLLVCVLSVHFLSAFYRAENLTKSD